MIKFHTYIVREVIHEVNSDDLDEARAMFADGQIIRQEFKPPVTVLNDITDNHDNVLWSREDKEDED